MKIKETLGIDVSKKTIDAVIYGSKTHEKFDNNTKGFKEMQAWFKKVLDLPNESILICFEHTGIYSLPLANYLSKEKLLFTIVPALEIKRSLGMARGKNDKVDALRIAEYAYLRREKLKVSKLPSENIQNLQKLISLRDKVSRQRAGYLADSKEMKEVLSFKDCKDIIGIECKIIKYLTKQMQSIEVKIKLLIEADMELKKLYDLITSVKGIGMVLAINLLVTTNCFTSFENSRKYACYAGIVPFEKQSGTSIKSASKVSQLANKKIKSLLHVASMSAIQWDSELKAYYLKRTAQGKNKMSTLNIIRNKLVHRVFAVVKRQTPYVEIKRYA